MGKANPEQGASWVSRLLYLWMNPLLHLGVKRPLEFADLWELSQPDLATTQAERFHREWSKEKNERDAPSFVRAVIRAHLGLFFRAAPLKLFYDALAFVGPFALHGLLKGLQQGGGMGYALLLVCSMFLQTMLLQQYFAMCFRAGIHVRTGVMSAIYTKALRLSTTSRNEESVGQMVNLMSVDAYKIGPYFLPYAHLLWSSPLQITVAFCILYQLVGVGALSGGVVILLVVPINLLIARKHDQFQTQMMQRKDERMRILSEVLNCIRQIKFFAWEAGLQKRIMSARGLELQSLIRGTFWGALGGMLWSWAPLAVSCTAFGTMAIATEAPLTPERAFVALTLFNIITFPMSMFPYLVNSAIEARVASKRIERFLLSAEAPGRRSCVSEDAAAGFNNASYTWNESSAPLEPSEREPLLEGPGGRTNVLREISCKLDRGSVTSVVGPVGSGKSSLLLALLGEMPCVSGGETPEFINGEISYAAQTPWLMHATLRDNILFGEEFDEWRYRQVVSTCCLEDDFAGLKDGDKTEIGEKGINLSGGQKARVALARCIYRISDVYIFDDPLSAVDAHVGRTIFDQVIMGSLLEGKTRILVTHQVQYLDRVDRVIVMEKGTIVADGSFDQLKKAGHKFSFLSLSTSANPAQKPQELESSVKEAGAANESEKTIPGEQSGKLMTTEERATGNVSLRVYLEYMMAAGLPVVFAYLALTLGAIGSTIAVNSWLSRWTEAAIHDGFNFSMNGFYVRIYMLLALGASIFMCVQSLLQVYAIYRTGKILHDRMLVSVLRAPVSFFDSTPVGRILNRFSKDQTSIDEDLPEALSMYIWGLMEVTGSIFVIMFVTWKIVFLIVPLAFLYNSIGHTYISTSRELQRLDSVTKSPILALFGETLTGVETLRAFDAAPRFLTDISSRIDDNTKSVLWNVMSNRWLSVRLETVGALLVGSAAILAIMSGKNIATSLAGLSISYALLITQSLSWMVRMSTETETQMNAVERISYYSHLESEARREYPGDPSREKWPSTGRLSFDKVELRYRPELEPALKSVSFTIEAGEKVGVVGRTGAGKTSLAQALFRMVELSRGRIVLDGVDISKVGLLTLRSRVAIVTQDPMLVSATVRYNLDPFEDHSDAAIWKSLGEVSMTEVVQEMGGLDAVCQDLGQNFSVGQRQLMCLARALLHDSKLMVLDEATAAIDHETDQVVQEAIRHLKSDCTMIIIAHRLQTVMDVDKIIVMSKGTVGEMGSPEELLQETGGLLYKLVSEVGGDAAEELRLRAKRKRPATT